ncbi:hypothetical protein F4810DRAFT_718445 [Camillea tinctor]|nr:hypothetical protein F4810DRAFT_718445 [Camillea tinctor]
MMHHQLPLFMSLIPCGGLTWYSPQGNRLLSNRDSRKLVKAFKNGLPRLTPRAVDRFVAVLFYKAIKKLPFCKTMHPDWFWQAVGNEIAWCRKLDDTLLLVKFVHKCMCAQTMYCQIDTRDRNPDVARLSKLAVAVWRFKIVVHQTFNDVPSRQLFVPPSVFSPNPEAEGPVAKCLIRRRLRRRQKKASQVAHQDASLKEQDVCPQVDETYASSPTAVDSSPTAVDDTSMMDVDNMDIDFDIDIDIDGSMQEEPSEEHAKEQPTLSYDQFPVGIESCVRAPLVSLLPMSDAMKQAMQLARRHHRDDEDFYYEVVEEFVAETLEAESGGEEEEEEEYEPLGADEMEHDYPEGSEDEEEEEEDDDNLSFCTESDYDIEAEFWDGEE